VLPRELQDERREEAAGARARRYTRARGVTRYAPSPPVREYVVYYGGSVSAPLNVVMPQFMPRCSKVLSYSSRFVMA